MKYLYLRYVDLSQFEFFYELDDEGYAVRQIELEDDSESVDISCLDACLSEANILSSLKEEVENRGYTILKNIEKHTELLKSIGVFFIDKESFEKEWEKQTRPWRKAWEYLKNRVHIGDTIKATVMFFYPQGTIVNYDGHLCLYE